ncbi:MAG: hypothetical protein KatS3mg010_2125 [Acidimicrobiia bacterium]|nr:MAG: hypothetical protein KatS3mg010_2125 [Acidimicrobiia bacterium]
MTRCSATRTSSRAARAASSRRASPDGQEPALDETGETLRAERDGSPPERLHVAEPTGTLLQVGLQHLGDRPRPHPPRVGGVRQRGQEAGAPAPGEVDHPRPQGCGQFAVARDRRALRAST